MKSISRLLILAIALLASHAYAGARDDLKSFTSGLKGLDGQFVQQVYDRGGKLKETSDGRVALTKPNLFRWEYRKPYEQLIVADGNKVWIYEPDLQQATVRDQGTEEQNSPLAALFEPATLDTRFNVGEAAEAAGLRWLVLTPKSQGDASFQSARLGFGENGLAKMQVIDAVGQRTDISFSGWKRNPSFATGTFKYAPGKDVDVVGER